jgi:hypothetical protein
MELRRHIAQFVRNRPLLWQALNPINRGLRRNIQTARMRLGYGTALLNDVAAANQLLHQILRDGKPHGVAKIGSLEAEAMQTWLRRREASTAMPWSPILRRQMLDNVGIHPPEDTTLDRFCQDYLAALAKIDVLGVLGGPGEAGILRQPGAPGRLIRWRAIEPWHFADPWTAELAGKRVVVVHPFAATIQAQYARRDKIWRNPRILPEFALRTVRMPLSPGLVPSPYPDWRSQFDALVAELEQAPYDVLLVGAGGVSLLFAAHACATGRVGIHMGGGTQVLFGIRGRRWDKSPELLPFINEYWTRPSAAESPETRAKVEQGCYW